MVGRVLAYGLFGCATEYAFTVLAGRPKPPHPVMLPVYGLAAPLFGPVHDLVRGANLPLRALTYGLVILAVEYFTGRLLRRAGVVAWDYSRARWNVARVTRLDYLPLWSLHGLALERLAERLD